MHASLGPVEPPLVGRGAELARFDEVLARAAEGGGGLVTLIGEPGVGKSRLAREAMRLAVGRGFRVLLGAAGPYQEEVSYAPLVEAVRPLLTPEELRRRPRLLDGLADLGRLFSDLPLRPPVPLGDPGVERARLFEAVWRLLERTARETPLVIVLEDLHWADPATLSLLQYVAHSVGDQRMVVVCTVRPGRLPESLASLFMALRSGHAVTEFAVAPLDPAAVGALLGELLDGQTPRDLLRLLDARARGIPLFVLGLVSMLRESGKLVRSGGQWVLVPGGRLGVPPGVAGLLRARLDGLDPADRSALEVVAVCGDAATSEVLAAVGGPVDLTTRLARLRTAGFVAEEPAGSEIVFRASHPLLAEVAYEELLEVERRRIHAAVAAAVARRWPDDLSRLATHVARAGAEVDRGYALDVLSAAAGYALDRRAGEEALRHAKAALVLAAELERGKLMDTLTEQVAEATELVGRSEDAVDAWVAAAAATADLVRRADRLCRAATVEWRLGRFDAAEAHLDEAARLLAGLDAVEQRIRVGRERLLIAIRGSGQEAAAPVLAELRELALLAAHRGVPKARALSAFLEPRDWADGAYMSVIGSPGSWPDLPSIADDPVLLAQAHKPWIIAATLHGNVAEARRRAAEARSHAVTVGSPVMELAPIILGGWAEFLAGDWKAALRAADEALAIAYRVGAREIAAALALRAVVQLHRGEADVAQACVTEARGLFGERDRHVSGTVNAVAALTALAAGDVKRALQLVADTRLDTYAPLLAQETRAEALLAGRDMTAARSVAATLDDLPEPSRYATAIAHRIRGLLALAEGDREAAARWLSAAEQQLATLPIPFDLGRVRLELAELTEDPIPARQALEMLEALGARPTADRARRLLRRLGLRAAAPTQRRGANVLSAREAQVARLVALGLSNAEVAERLFISPRTVTTHLEKIYRRLGLAGRTALARYVLEREPPDT